MMSFGISRMNCRIQFGFAKYKAVVIPTLENMQKVLQQSDPNDFSQYLSLAEKVFV